MAILAYSSKLWYTVITSNLLIAHSMRNHRSSFFFITLWLSLGASLPAFAADYTTSTFLSNDDAGTNGPAADAYVDEPRGFDAANGEIYLVDTINNRVEKIGTDGILTNVAGAGDYGYRDGSSDYALFAQPQDIAIYGDTASELFIADTNNNVIRKIKDGEVSTLLSGLSSPQGVAVDGDTVFISDTGNNRILGIDHNGGATVEFGKNLDQPT
ncbi:MAG: Serine/threonine protein kinase, partial [uncultured bacterium]